jgi:S-disulfanyl-L-cysteine oxidoreductase SoxD
MRPKVGIFGLAALLVLVVAGPGEAQAGGKTIWDGVYTAAQANRGQQTVQQNCVACHSAQEWSNTGFLGAWSGRSVRDLHVMIRSSMPLDAPGRLSRQEYSDVIAYMLRLSDAPTGERELPAGDEELGTIQVTRRAQ